MGIFLSIFSYILDGTGNFIDKYLLEKYSFTPPIIAIVSGTFVLILSLAILAIHGLHSLNLSVIAALIVSGFLTQFFIVPYYKALSLEDPSRIAPFFQLVPVMVLAISYFALGESLTPRQYLGSAIIIFSSVLISIDEVSLKTFRIRKAFWYIMGANLCTALGILLFNVAVKEIDFWVSLPYEGVGFVFCSILIFLFQKKRVVLLKRLTSSPLHVVAKASVNEAIYISARYLRYFAVTLIPVGIVAVLGVSQQMFMVFLGLLLTIYLPNVIKETIKKEELAIKFIAIALIGIGLFLIFL